MDEITPVEYAQLWDEYCEMMAELEAALWEQDHDRVPYWTRPSYDIECEQEADRLASVLFDRV